MLNYSQLRRFVSVAAEMLLLHLVGVFDIDSINDNVSEQD